MQCRQIMNVCEVVTRGFKDSGLLSHIISLLQPAENLHVSNP